MRIQRALRVQAGIKYRFVRPCRLSNVFAGERLIVFPHRVPAGGYRRESPQTVSGNRRASAYYGKLGQFLFHQLGNKAVDVEPALIRQVLSRIPRSLHIDSANVRLMGVNWFGGDAGSPCRKQY